MEVPTELIGCDASGCTRFSASVSCHACSAAYYCSEQCCLDHKEAHHEDCQMVLSKLWVCRETVEDPTTEKGSTISIPIPTSLTDGETTTCSICLEDPNSKLSPIVTLEACKHVFCLPCLVQWQRKSASDLATDTVLNGAPPTSSTLTCPSCRTRSDPPELNLLQKAMTACSQGRHPGCPPELKDAFLEKAYLITAALLQVQDPELGPMLVMAEALIPMNRPGDAVDTARRLVKMDKERHAAIQANPILAWSERAHALRAASRVPEAAHAFQRASQMATMFPTLATTGPPLLRGRDRTDMYLSVYLVHAEALCVLGRWPEALLDFQWLEVALVQAPDSFFDSAKVQVWKGLSMCHFEMKDYSKAIDAADRAILADRSFAGVHRYKALSLTKQAENSAGSANDLLSQAVLTMNQGVLYEAPWDHKTQMSNLELFNSLRNEMEVQTITPHAHN